MAVDELNLMVLQMAVESVRSLSLSFAEKAAEIATRSRGSLLFNVRIDGDAQVQRVAAIRYHGGQFGVLALDGHGLVTHYCIVNGMFSHYIAALESWHRMPLSMQAKMDANGNARLFVEALRDAGHMLGT
ncbi:hypothetical protein NKH64_28230 [Mesorhizobium sp. M0999]|uniref:hypothetical protein n=1 Tax=unclassified Mesorhizobium TaxID=325217 RepID=UPI0003D00379|nr:hypothetical protein [Mesorhizobium sp. L103C119B0]ESZ56823.1 hypothetical protein X727_32695 [Mesorhizobium sp. L103C119B0]